MTTQEIIKLAEEYEVEKTKTIVKPHYYKRNGQVLERSYPDRIYTDRYFVLSDLLYNNKNTKVFQCRECGEFVHYGNLENWLCDFEKESYLCSCCYETDMGEDL